LPTILDVSKTEEQKQVWRLLLSPVAIGYALSMAPGIPADRVTILRKAFDALSRDQDFLQDAIAAMRFQPRFEVGAAGEHLFKQASQVSPEVVNFLRRYIDEANR